MNAHTPRALYAKKDGPACEWPMDHSFLCCRGCQERAYIQREIEYRNRNVLAKETKS